MLSSRRDGALYIGVTNDLIRRVWEHKNKIVEGFSKKYNTDKLVYFEQSSDIESAIQREKRLKKWNRQWKVDLLQESNPEWRDLYYDLI
jgi:putative endonuclease